MELLRDKLPVVPREDEALLCFPPEKQGIHLLRSGCFAEQGAQSVHSMRYG